LGQERSKGRREEDCLSIICNILVPVDTSFLTNTYRPVDCNM
jgi:hypothetical protein